MFTSAYSEKKKVVVNFPEKGLTKQNFKKECDINHIMAKFQKTGAIEHRNAYQGQYGDIPAITFHEAMNLVLDAQEQFMSLPSSLRKRFSNDPAEYLDFVQDSANLDEMVKLGLANAPSPAEPSAGMDAGAGTGSPVSPESASGAV